MWVRRARRMFEECISSQAHLEVALAECKAHEDLSQMYDEAVEQRHRLHGVREMIRPEDLPDWVKENPALYAHFKAVIDSVKKK